MSDRIHSYDLKAPGSRVWYSEGPVGTGEVADYDELLADVLRYIIEHRGVITPLAITFDASEDTGRFTQGVTLHYDGANLD